MTNLNPMTGIVASLRGEHDTAADAELKESLAAGWNPEFPAIDDEHGVRLVGNRRTRIAKTLGIEPVVRVVAFGDDEEADVERMRFAVISNIGTATLTTEDRKRAAIYLKQTHNWTQTAIGRALGVNQSTVARYLEETLCTPHNVSEDALDAPKEPPKDTLGRKRSPGRPPKPKESGATKASKGTKVSNKKLTEQEEEEIYVRWKAGDRSRAIGKEYGVGEHVIQLLFGRFVEREKFEAAPPIDASTLSMTAQEKLELAVRQHKAVLAAKFHDEVNARVKVFLAETILPQHKREQARAKQVMDARKGVMDKATFNAIRRGLHPDSRKSISDAALGHAFDKFMALEKLLLNERNSPTEYQDIPSSQEEWDKAKREATAARKAKRSSNSQQPAVR